MEPASLFLKDPSTSRFLGGGLAEAESLLGAPLPLLPAPDLDDGKPGYSVQFDPRLRSLLQRFLRDLLGQIGAEIPGVPKEAAGRGQSEYEPVLARLLRSIRSIDRRHGLSNLFWLAHTKDAALQLRQLEAKAPAVRKAKYSLHPLLASFYRRVEQAARKELEQADPGRWMFLTGSIENQSLVESLIEDGLAFTEVSITDLDFNQFLAANKRYRLTPDIFFEIYQVLVKETERRFRDGDRGLLNRMARHLPALTKEQCQTQAGVVKVMMTAPILTYLLGDAWGTGTRLMASPKLKAEAERRRPAEMVDAFLDLVAAVKRFELVAHVRDRVALRALGADDEPGRSAQPARVYEFGESAQVLNNAVNATVLFLDLRGFTKTSEGQISERDLTRELYTVFDEFVPLVRRFGGTVDKFLGDGIMITYGTDQARDADVLNAVRTAILCQEALHDLRQKGQTYFKMGIAIHYGRVYVARFIADEDSVQNTVIGRNVNLAGRLSSAAKKPMEEDEPDIAPMGNRVPGLRVTVDQTGTLFNEGIAISRDSLVQLESHLPLTRGDPGGELEYFDEQIARRMLIRYAGDAKFKGVGSSFPVYEVGFES